MSEKSKANEGEKDGHIAVIKRTILKSEAVLAADRGKYRQRQRRNINNRAIRFGMPF